MLALRDLENAGVITPPQQNGHSGGDAVSEEERERVAEAIGRGPGKSVSEIIIEERGEP